MKLQELFQKITTNLKNISNSRLGVLVAIFIPIILVLLLGIAFNEETAMTMKVGYYFPNANNVSQTYEQAFAQQGFLTIKLLSEEACVYSVKYGLVHACLASVQSNTSNTSSMHIYMSSENIPYLSSLLKSFVATEGASLSSGDVKLNFLNDISKLNTGLDQQKKQLDETKNGVLALEQELKGIISSGASGSSQGSGSPGSSVTVEQMDFSSSKSQLLKDLEDLNDLTFKGLEKVTNKLDDIEDEVKDSDLSSSQKDNVNELLEDANDVVKELKTDLAAQSGLVNTSLDTIISDINKAQSTLSYASGKIEPASGTAASPQIISLSQKVKAISNNLDTMVNTLSVVQEVINNLENTPTTSLSQKSPSSLKSIENTDTSAALLGVYLFLIILVTMLLATHLIHEKRFEVDIFKSPQLFYDTLVEFFATTFVFNLVVSIFIFVVFSLFATKAFIAHFHLSILPLFLITALFSSIGIIIGIMIKDLEASVFADIVVFSAMAFFSDTILKYGNETIVSIKEFNPYVISQNVMMNIMLLGSPWADIKQQVFYVIAFIVGGVIILLLMLHKYKDKFSSSPHKDEHGNEVEYEEEHHDKEHTNVSDKENLGSAEDVIQRLEEIGEKEVKGGDHVDTGDLSVEEYKHLQTLVKKAGKKVEKLLEEPKTEKKEKQDQKSESKHEHASADHLVERLKIEADIVELVKKKDYSKKELKKKLLESYNEEDIDAVFEEVFK
ncbi:hypothetical protein HYY69_07695 [Candidatus Woesearchaeota archaeon]|nr:hypothetical protein [Candidatus Woesearchaeota archaeon]